MVRSWSQAAERLLGLGCAEAVGKPLAQLFSAGAHESPAVAAGAPNEFSPARPWSLRDGSGESRAFRQTVLPLPPCGCGDRLFLCMVWPEARPVARVEPRPEATNDPMAAVAARIAHDFNRLIAPVLGNVILLEEETPSTHHSRQRLVGIREATEAARVFAQRLTALDPRRKLALESVNLSHVVRDCLPAVRAPLRADITVEDSLDANADSVRVNPKQIEQALVQLAQNAQDAMPAGGKLSIVLDMVESVGGSVPAGRWVRLRVRDNGRGMEPSLLDHAFEPFVSTKVPGCGAGLGLPAVSAIVRQHGGAIEIESQSGEGATVAIYLPSNGSPGQERERPPVARAANSAPAPATSTASLLLVEDNPMVRRSIETTLRGMGYRVLAVESGECCMEAVKDPTVKVDLLITDIVMPEMSGKELIERVHALRPGLPVLFMSGYDRSTLASRKQSVTAEHFLQKPFDSQDLARSVRAAIGLDADPPGVGNK